MMELRHLRYFVAIAEERSFTGAAERLWVAQPGLSTQIRRLEVELGVTLFIRHTRGVDLTEAGALFLERARVAIETAEIARRVGSDLETGKTGSLRLGLSSVPTWGAAGSLLHCFARRRPAVEVSVVEAYGGALMRDLRDDRLDAVLAPAIFGSADLERLSVGEERWLVLVGSNHRLAGAGPLAATDLRDEQIAVTGHRDGAGYDRAVGEALAAAGVDVSMRRRGTGPAIHAAVADGDVLALVTSPAPDTGELLVRPLAPARTLDFELFWRAGTASPALNELVRTAHDQATAPADRRLRAAA